MVVNYPKLRPHQRQLYDARQRFCVWVCHRRFGKTTLALYCLIHDALSNRQPRPRYAYVAPLYRQAKLIAWDLLKHLTHRLPGTHINEAELRVDLHHDARIQLFGADNPDALRGPYWDGVLFDEFAQMRPRVWSEVVRPSLADREGWATFIGTPMGHNHFYDLYQQAHQQAAWHSALYRASDTGIVTDEELASARGTMAPEQYAQEFECFPPDTLVLTSRGALPIAEISIGEMVLTHRGRWRPVTQTMQRPYAGPMVVLETFGGSRPLTCTPDHPVLLANWREQTYRWAPASMVEEGDYICFPRHAIGPPLIPAELASLLAWYIAEGSVQQNAVNFALGPTETAYAETILAAAGTLGWKGSIRHVRTGLVVHIGSTQLADFLAMHGGKGAAQKQLPLPLICGHERLVWETLFAADGHVREDGRGHYATGWYYTTVSESLALSLQTLGHTLGYQGGYLPRAAGTYTIEGRTGPSRPSYLLMMREGGNQSQHARRAPKLRQAKNAVVGKVRRVRRGWHEGTVYNLAVAMDESYTAYGRAVHNCSFESALIGAYYASYLQTAQEEGRLTRVPWDPAVPVHTAWDLGVSDSTAIWFIQPHGSMLHVIDYLEASDHGLEWYAKALQAKPYVYGRHYFPHDIDQRDFSGSGLTRLQMAEQLGLRPTVVAPRGDVADGIQAVRTLFPRLVFDAEACYDGLEALKAYRRQWNEVRKDWEERPYHDFASHAADALRTFCVMYQPEQPAPALLKPPQRFSAGRVGAWIRN